MTLGYCLYGADTHDLVLGDNGSKAPPDPCKECASIHEINFLPGSIKIPRTKKDLYESWDGFLFASESFRRFCSQENYQYLEFTSLPLSNYYWLKVHQVIAFVQENNFFTRGVYDSSCKGFKQVATGGFFPLKDMVLVGDGFFGPM